MKQEKLEVRIQAFLDRKSKQFPELDQIKRS